jgi:hypothetical protein
VAGEGAGRGRVWVRFGLVWVRGNRVGRELGRNFRGVLATFDLDKGLGLPAHKDGKRAALGAAHGLVDEHNAHRAAQELRDGPHDDELVGFPHPNDLRAPPRPSAGPVRTSARAPHPTRPRGGPPEVADLVLRGRGDDSDDGGRVVREEAVKVVARHQLNDRLQVRLDQRGPAAPGPGRRSNRQRLRAWLAPRLGRFEQAAGEPVTLTVRC